MSRNFLTQAILPLIYYTTGRHVDSTAVPSFVYETVTLVAFFGYHRYSNNIHVTWRLSTGKVFVFCRTGGKGQRCKVWGIHKLICHCFLEPLFQSWEESCPSVVSRKGTSANKDFQGRHFQQYLTSIGECPLNIHFKIFALPFYDCPLWDNVLA